MAAARKYTVKTPFRHDGKDYKPGDKVALDLEVAKKAGSDVLDLGTAEEES